MAMVIAILCKPDCTPKYQSTRLRRTIPRSKACDICGLKTRCWDDAGEYDPFKWAKEVSKSENMGGIWKLQFQL